jgi:signal transduction histidine kinase
VRQPGTNAQATPSGGPTAAPFPSLRLQQFLDIERAVLTTPADPATVASHLAQGVTLFLAATGAAVGLVDNGVYGLLAHYGLDQTYRRRYEGLRLGDSPLADLLHSSRPFVLVEPPPQALHTLVLPLRAHDVLGALQVVHRADVVLADDDTQLALALALLVGAALVNARRAQHLTCLARVKSDALSAMAHDLRAPLNALVGYASLLADQAFGPLSTEQREVAASLERQALELVDLLGATLDVARLETGVLPVRSEEFAFEDVVTTLFRGTFARAVHAGRLTSTVAADLPRLRTDRIKVKQIVQNLVDNALKHGEGSTVQIDAVVVPDRDTIRITVRDTGPGIAGDLLPRLFEPFRPGPAAGGTGLGLYLVRTFAEALGGRTAARSVPGTGTAITVELPLVLPGR